MHDLTEDMVPWLLLTRGFDTWETVYS